MTRIVGLFGSNLRNQLKRDWSNQDIAELYRVEASLVQAGMRIDTERGVADEGDPWFVFCHRDSSEVIVHFARIDGQYVVASPALPKMLSGPDLGTIVQRFVAENPVSMPSPDGDRRNNVVFHPAALLTIFVATILLVTSPDESLAATVADDDADNDADNDAAGDAEDIEASTAVAGAAGSAPGGDKLQRAENAFLVVAAALAIEAARALEQNGPNAVGLAGLDLGLLSHDAKVDLASHDGFVEIGLLSLSDAYASHDELQKQSAIIVEPEKVELDGALISGGGTAYPASGNIILLPGSKTPFNTSLLLDGGALAELPSHSTGHAMFNQAETTLVSADREESLSLQTPTGGEAHTWFDEKAAASGWLPALHGTQNLAEASFVVDFVESGKIDGDVVEFETAGSGNEIGDQAVWNIVKQFMESDDDINQIADANGLIIYDQSDLSDGDMLKLHAWVFDDGTSLAIVGHSDTVTDVMAGTA